MNYYGEEQTAVDRAVNYIMGENRLTLTELWTIIGENKLALTELWTAVLWARLDWCRQIGIDGAIWTIIAEPKLV